MDNDDFLDLMERWEVPTEFHPMLSEMIEQYGEELVHEGLQHRTEPHDEASILEWKKYIEDQVLFIADKWHDVTEILYEAFEFDSLVEAGIMDEDEIFQKIEKKQILHFYTVDNKKVICVEGSRINSNARKLIQKGIAKAQESRKFWAELKSNK